MSHTEALIGKLSTEEVRAQLRYLYGDDEQLVKAQEEKGLQEMIDIWQKAIR